jgi:hypothetical protein
MSIGLKLKPCAIAGQTCPDDWSVMYMGEAVDRIMRRDGIPPDSPQWFCSVTLPSVVGQHGAASSIDECKAKWRAAWERLDAVTIARGIEQIARTQSYAEAWEKKGRASVH